MDISRTLLQFPRVYIYRYSESHLDSDTFNSIEPPVIDLNNENNNTKFQQFRIYFHIVYLRVDDTT